MSEGWAVASAPVRWTTAAIADAVGGRLLGNDVTVDGAGFDSRALVPGQLFVAVVAERDGHEYLDAAVAGGAGAVLVSRPVEVPVPAILVDDTMAAYAQLGAATRDRLPDRVIGVTGSVGKTSVKDLAAAAVAGRWVTAANVRSFNNELGLPTTLLNAPDDTEAVVVEMGMRGFGHIRDLCEIARPTVGIVTVIGAAHLEFVGSLEGVAKAKGELVEALPDDGLAVLNADQDLCMGLAMRTNAEVLTFGLTSGEVRVESLVLDELARPRFVLRTPWGSAAVELQVSGSHMAANAAAAAAAALGVDVPLDAVVERLSGAQVSPWRMEVRRARSGLVVVNDAYNANPTSMLAALDALAALRVTGRRVAIVGTMAELGDDAVAAHRSVTERATALGIEVIAVGTDAYGVRPVADVLAAVADLGDGDAVLVKASRVAGLEKVAAALLQS